MAKKTLRTLYSESELFEPKPKDEKTSWNWHKNSKMNTVDDHTRNSRGGVDRAGNKRGLYNGETTPYPRKSNRMGYDGDGSDARAFDLGRAAGVNQQARPGLTQTSVPVVVTSEGEIVFMPDLDEQDLTEAAKPTGKIFPHLDDSPDSHKTRMVHSVTSYDRSRQDRPDHNRYALGHYLMASDRAHEDMKNGAHPAEAINNQFNGALANRLHKHLGTGGEDVDTMRKKSWK